MIRVTPTYNPNDWYWVVGDTNPTTQVWSTTSAAYVANTAAAYLAWLDSNQWGTGANILSAADNGVGLIRLTVDTTTQMQTGQVWRIIDDLGTQSAHYTITVIDATHVDMQLSTFLGTITGILGSATVIDTDAHLRATLNIVNVNTTAPVVPGFITTSTNSTTISNPLTLRYVIRTLNAAGANPKIILPKMRNITNAPLGVPITFVNAGLPASTDQPWFTIFAQDGTTSLVTLEIGDTFQLTLTDNTTDNGTWRIDNISVIQSPSYVRGAIGQIQSNSIFTLTSFDDMGLVSFDRQGSSRRVNGNASASADITVAGPAAGGRDQGAAFAATADVSFFAIWGPTTGVSLIASLNQPQQGPAAMPTGYTHWCFIHLMKLAGGNLRFGQLMGSLWSYEALQTVLVNGGAVVATAVNCSPAVPTWAQNFWVMAISVGITSNGTGVYNDTLKTQWFNTVDYTNSLIAGTAAINAVMQAPIGAIIFPNYLQAATFYYYHVVGAGAGPLATFTVSGYTVPNGDGF